MLGPPAKPGASTAPASTLSATRWVANAGYGWAPRDSRRLAREVIYRGSDSRFGMRPRAAPGGSTSTARAMIQGPSAKSTASCGSRAESSGSPSWCGAPRQRALVIGALRRRRRGGGLECTTAARFRKDRRDPPYMPRGRNLDVSLVDNPRMPTVASVVLFGLVPGRSCVLSSTPSDPPPSSLGRCGSRWHRGPRTGRTRPCRWGDGKHVLLPLKNEHFRTRGLRTAESQSRPRKSLGTAGRGRKEPR